MIDGAYARGIDGSDPDQTTPQIGRHPIGHSEPFERPIPIWVRGRSSARAWARLVAQHPSWALAVALLALGSLALGSSLSSLGETYAPARQTTTWPEADQAPEAQPMGSRK
jgi:hypothetical protein